MSKQAFVISFVLANILIAAHQAIVCAEAPRYISRFIFICKLMRSFVQIENKYI